MFDYFSNQSRPFIILYHHFVFLLSPLISWIPKYVTRVIRRVPLVEQELLTLPEHLRSPSVLSGVRVARYLVFYLVFCMFLFCMFLFVLSSFSSLYCLNVFSQHLHSESIYGNKYSNSAIKFWILNNVTNIVNVAWRQTCCYLNLYLLRPVMHPCLVTTWQRESPSL